MKIIHYLIVSKVILKNKALLFLLFLIMIIIGLFFSLMNNIFWQIINIDNYVQKNFWNKNQLSYSTFFSFSLILLPILFLNTFLLPIVLLEIKRDEFIIQMLSKNGKRKTINLVIFIFFLGLSVLIFLLLFIFFILEKHNRENLNKINFIYFIVGYINFHLFTFSLGFLLGTLYKKVISLLLTIILIFFINLFSSFVFINYEWAWKNDNFFYWWVYLYPVSNSSELFNLAFYEKIGAIAAKQGMELQIIINNLIILPILNIALLNVLNINPFYKRDLIYILKESKNETTDNY